MQAKRGAFNMILWRSQIIFESNQSSRWLVFKREIIVASYSRLRYFHVKCFDFRTKFASRADLLSATCDQFLLPMEEDSIAIRGKE